MKKIMKKLRLKMGRKVFMALCVASVEASAGGLWINEYGSPVMGRAGAGAEAGTDDASAAFHNPASMSRMEQKEVMVTGGLVYAETAFNLKESTALAGDDDGGDAGGTSVVGSAFYVKPLNDSWRLGVSFVGLTGAELDYNRGWAGRLHSESVEIVGLSLMPSLSYQVNDKFSVGVGLPILYASMEMVIGGPDGGKAEIDGDDTVVGYHLSAHYELSDTTRMGMFYQSEFEVDFGGDGKTSDDFLPPPGQSASVNTEMTFAAKLYTGITHEFSDELSGHATFGWEEWSSMEDVNLSVGGGVALSRNWDDTYHYAVGLEYELAPTWLLNAGIGYDTSPAASEYRTADMAIDRQVRYAVGFEHDRDSGPTVAVQLVYADYGSGQIDDNDPAFGFSGDYKDNDILFLSVSTNWKLGE